MTKCGVRPGGAAKVRALIVDDSALVRNLLRAALIQHPLIEVVGMAADGVEALAKIAALRPDVVTLDVEMPRLDGLGVLERAAGKLPVSFVMVSTLTQAGARTTFEALRRGAFDYVPKPQRGGLAPMSEFRDLVQAKVIAAARAKGRIKRIFGGSASRAIPRLPPNHIKGWVVGIGISCGGPPTLTDMLPAFPSDFVPLVITQHMPAEFTGAFARQLDRVCALRVVEAAQGDVLEQGTAYVAPGDYHLKFRRAGIGIQLALDAGPRTSGHRPSVDAMFASLADVCGPRSVGILMTGMGNDGAEGIVRLSRAGAWTIAQDEASSLVYGMPKAAAATGCVDYIVPYSQIPAAVARLISEGARVPTAPVR
jgi:two-component system chemotaxis response regulator CheB